MPVKSQARHTSSLYKRTENAPKKSSRTIFIRVRGHQGRQCQPLIEVKFFLEINLRFMGIKRTGLISWLQKCKIFGILMLNGWGIHKKLHNIPIYWKHYFFGSFFLFLQVQSIALANNVHFCNQLSKLVLLIPMNPKFISKFFKPLLRGGSFFQWAGGSP